MQVVCVCVSENEWRMAKATAEKYPETENPSGGPMSHVDRDSEEVVHSLS